MLYAALLALAPPSVARVLAFAILFGHAVGASTWLVRWGAPGWLLAALLLLLASRVLSYGWQTGVPDAGGASQQTPDPV